MNTMDFANSAYFARARLRSNLTAQQALSAPVLAIDAAVIVLSSVATGVIFHLVSYGHHGDVNAFVATGLITAALFCAYIRNIGPGRRADFTGAGRLRTAVVDL